MALKSSISVIVNVNNQNMLGNLIATQWVLVNGMWVECALVSIPSFDTVWLDNSYFVAWAS